MNMTWLECILYGLLSGLTEILPVSSQAHEALLSKLFGMEVFPLLRLLVHTAVWEALYLAVRRSTDRMLRERELSRIPAKYRERQPDPIAIFDLRLLRTALIPMVLGFVAYPYLDGWRMDLSKSALFLMINGIVLYLPRIMMSGNKDSRAMTGVDALIIGLCGGCSVIPGMSMIATTVTAATARGADRENALGWALHLALGAMTAVVVWDAWLVLQSGAGPLGAVDLLLCTLGTAAAFGGAFAAILLVRFLSVKAGFGAFAYYSWGAALFAFIMYLTI